VLVNYRGYSYLNILVINIIYVLSLNNGRVTLSLSQLFSTIGMCYFLRTSYYYRYTHHIVKTNGVNGNMCEINYGLPRGSLLGTILFILYINEICDINIEGSIVTYANDACLHFSHNTWEGVYEKSINGFRKVL